jgi:hypothetical protein
MAGDSMLKAKLAWQGDGHVATCPPHVTSQERFLTPQRASKPEPA